MSGRTLVVLCFIPVAVAQSQSPQNVYTVLPWSATGNLTVPTSSGNVVLPNAVSSIFGQSRVPTVLNPASSQFITAITTPSNYGIAQSIIQMGNALNSSIATALSVMPLASPASGVILKTDAATGAALPVNSTLGPIFTERAETIGRKKLYIGLSHQTFHFTELNGSSLNGMTLLYGGGAPSNITTAGGQVLNSLPASFNVGMDVRVSQNVAFITYGVTDRFDVSVGLPLIHAAVASRTYNGLIYAGSGNGTETGSNCWCADTFTPGSPNLTQPIIGSASYGKTGFGDMLLRLKGTVVEKPGYVLAVGTDFRFPTGEAENYLGTGTTTVKPFMALSIYSKPTKAGIVFAPHFNLGWQFSGKSILGGELQGTPQSVNGISYVGAPFTSTKDFLPDVMSWAVGAEVALGKRNTVIVDVLGNQIGWVHGIPNPVTQTIGNALSPIPNSGSNPPTYPSVSVTGLASGIRTSFGQYNGSFGFKTRLMGNLVLTFNALVRFDNNGLTSKFTPLYGLGYTF